MGIIEAIKKGFGLSGKLMKVVTIFFILNLIIGLISIPLAKPENAGKPGIIALSFVVTLIFFVIFIYIQGGALGLAKDAHKTGNVDMANFAAYGKKFYIRILVLLLLYILIALAVVLILSLIGSGILALANNAFTKALVAVIAAVVAFLVIVVLLFPIYAIVADDLGVIEALKKGASLARENFWKITGLFLCLVAISVLISLAVGFVVGLATVPLPFKVTQVIIAVINSAVQSYIPIVMMLALMGYYLEMSGAISSGSSGTQETHPA